MERKSGKNQCKYKKNDPTFFGTSNFETWLSRDPITWHPEVRCFGYRMTHFIILPPQKIFSRTLQVLGFIAESYQCTCLYYFFIRANPTICFTIWICKIAKMFILSEVSLQVEIMIDKLFILTHSATSFDVFSFYFFVPNLGRIHLYNRQDFSWIICLRIFKILFLELATCSPRYLVLKWSEIYDFTVLTTFFA